MDTQSIKRCINNVQHHKKLMSLIGLLLLITLALLCKFVLFSSYSPFSEKTVSYHHSASSKPSFKASSSSTDSARTHTMHGSDTGISASHSKGVSAQHKTQSSGSKNTQYNVPSAGATLPADRDITVYVSGAVTTPGMYTLKTPARIDDALAQAGGFSDAADRDRVNLAQKLSDGQHVYIPRIGERASVDMSRTHARSSRPQSRRQSSNASSSYPVPTDEISADNPLNLNTASKEELMQLKGVGASLAKRILDYRSMRGSFQSKEELLMIAGIGEKLYAQIESLIYL